MDESFARSVGILDPTQTLPINVIGCGSIGSFTALCLAKMGFTQKFHLWDDDSVEIHNVGCQLFGKSHIGMPKVEALKMILMELTPLGDEHIVTHFERVEKDTPMYPLISFVGVDSMKARSAIWEKAKGKFNLLIDGRIGGQVIRVFTVRPGIPEDEFYYEDHLYSDSEASELPCTERNVCDVGFAVGSLMANQARKFIAGGTIQKEIILDMFNIHSFCE